MLIFAWAFFILMALSGLLAWCCIRVGAMSEQEFDEAQIASACEGAMISELSDIRFQGAAE